MKTLHYILLLLVLGLYSCQDTKVSESQNKITKLSFATGGCFGECPFLAFEIDSSLNYKFYGGQFVENQGYYKGKISKELWDTINMKLMPLQDRNFDTNMSTVDDMSIECLIHFGESVTKIGRQEMELPNDVRENFYWLMDTYKKVDLMKVTDTISFETLIQYGPPPAPTPSIKKN